MIINPQLALLHYRNYEEDPEGNEKEEWKKDE